MWISRIENKKFGAMVRDADCAGTSRDDALILQAALREHQLLIFPNQLELFPAQEVAF